MIPTLGRLLGIENAASIERIDMALAAPWAEGSAFWIFLFALTLFTGSLFFYVRLQHQGPRWARITLGITRGLLLAMLLLSERTWKHHLTTLLLIYLPVWQVLTCRDWSDKFRAWFVGGLVAQWVLLTGAGGLDAVFGDAAEDAMLGVGTVCFGLVLCFVQTAIMLRRIRRATQPA